MILYVTTAMSSEDGLLQIHSQELLMQQPGNSTPALMPWKTSRKDRSHSHGLNELTDIWEGWP